MMMLPFVARSLRSGVGIVAALVVLCAAPATAVAQVLYGSIVGNVTDATGGALPGVTVQISHNETKATREAVTAATGRYQFTTVQTGTYTIVAKLSGFETFTRTDVPVTLNTTSRVDVGLKVGGVQESITVEAHAEVLQTERAEIRQELRSREIQDLPVPLGRNYQELFRTLPGFTPPEDAHSIPSNPSRALVFNVNGTSRQGNNTRIDGVTSTNIWLPHVVAYVPALESIETVNVVTNNFDAEQGLAGGAAISVQIKSGTNQLKGSAFEYHFNERLKTRPYFTPKDRKLGAWRNNQYGGTLGGPVKPNKVFFFASYEGTRERRNVPNTLSVPTAAVRNGDFSGTGATIYNPFTGNPDGSGRVPFAGGIIPSSMISPVARRLIQYWPMPNLPNADGTMPEFNNYYTEPLWVFNRWTLDTKLNWNATERLHIFGRYSQLNFYQSNETVLGNQLQGAPGNGGNPGTGWGNTYNFSAGGTYTIGNNVVIDANFGWVRMGSNVEMTDSRENKGLDWLGIPGTNGPNLWDGGTPYFDLDGYTDLGTTQNFMPYYRNDDQYQVTGNVNWLKGSHNIRFGSDLYFTGLNHIQPEIADTNFGARGGFEFNSGQTNLRGRSGNNFQSFAAFLLGTPYHAGRLQLNEAPYTTRSHQYSVYIRDQWQASPKITLSYGMRWEYFPMVTRENRGVERYNLSTNMIEIGGVGVVPEDLGVKTQKNLFAPRVGATYRVSETSVLRGGFGVTNDPYSLARSMRTNHPVLTNLYDSAPNAFGYVRRIEEGIPLIPEPGFGNGVIPVPGNVTVITLPDEFKRGRVLSWNMAFQKELKAGFVAEAAYVGTRQIDQLGIREQNYPTIGGGSNSRQLYRWYGRTASTRLVAPIGDSRYHSLQTSLQRRFRNGFQFRVNYTLSRSNGLTGASNSDGTPRINMPDFYDLNYAISDFDRTHVVSITSLIELPFGPGHRWIDRPGLLGQIVGGWQLNTIVAFRIGTPFSVTASGTSLNAPGNTQVADRVGTGDVKILDGIGRGNSYFDPFAFAPVTDLRFGNSGFNSMRGPGEKSWDLGLFRRFALGGKRDFQFRFEVFNVTDTPLFNNPGTNVSSMTLNPDGSIRALNGYTEVTGTHGRSERTMRFGLRIGF